MLRRGQPDPDDDTVFSLDLSGAELHDAVRTPFES